MHNPFRQFLIVLVLLMLIVTACVGQATITTFHSDDTILAQDSNTEILIWAPGEAFNQWRAAGPVEAVKRSGQFAVEVSGVLYDIEEDRLETMLDLAIENGEAPDIVVLSQRKVPTWAATGRIVTLDECRKQYSEFEDVIDELWQSASWQGQLWGIPQQVDVRPLFFNKPKLKELGWTDSDIEALPQRIENGQFILEDVIRTAKQAVDAGVIAPGFGYWHRPTQGIEFLQTYVAFGGRLYVPDEGKLVVTERALQQWYAFQREIVVEDITNEDIIGPGWRSSLAWKIFDDAVSHQQVLFWDSYISRWSRWEAFYAADQGGEAYLLDSVGYALFPSGIRDRPGETAAETLLYVILSETVTGRDNQENACAVLAQTTTPEINSLHALQGAHLGILESQAEYGPYIENQLLAEAGYMLDYSWYVPNHEEFEAYFDILWEFMVKARSGEMNSFEAADEAIRQLQVELGEIIVE